MGLLDALVGNAAGLGVGDRAPAFTLADQDGRSVSLADFAGRKNVVVYFYPKDDTPGCTKESCSFRDQYTAFTDVGAEVIGISSDSQQSHKQFAEKYRLPFPLLADVGGEVRRQFKVPKSLGLLPGRVTFVIDKQGVIRHVFNSQLNATKHVDEAIGVLRTLG
ncbi:peroxiredoxin [bacterium]|nr:peroxiredoxin [bacterium]